MNAGSWKYILLANLPKGFRIGRINRLKLQQIANQRKTWMMFEFADRLREWTIFEKFYKSTVLQQE